MWDTLNCPATTPNILCEMLLATKVPQELDKQGWVMLSMYSKFQSHGRKSRICVNHIFFVQRVKNHAKLIHSWKGGSFLAKPKFPDMRGL